MIALDTKILFGALVHGVVSVAIQRLAGLPEKELHGRCWPIASFRGDAALRSLSAQSGHTATLKALVL
jgi:hypothetical protein